MAEKVSKVGVKRKEGYLYFVDKKGNVACAKMARGKKKGKAKIERRKDTFTSSINKEIFLAQRWREDNFLFFYIIIFIFYGACKFHGLAQQP